MGRTGKELKSKLERTDEETEKELSRSEWEITCGINWELRIRERIESERSKWKGIEK